MVSYTFIFGFLAGIGGIIGLVILVPQGESITTSLCNIQINGTIVKSCSKIHDSINFNSTRQLGISYNQTTQTIQFDVLTNATKLKWNVVSDPLGVTWTAQPLAETELLGLTHLRTKLDLSSYDEVRLNVVVVTVGSGDAKLESQYSPDCTTWVNIATSNPTVLLDSLGMQTSSWQKLSPNAKADVCLRIIGSGGNEILSPVFNSLQVQFR